jgi:hypothetical protein
MDSFESTSFTHSKSGVIVKMVSSSTSMCARVALLQVLLYSELAADSVMHLGDFESSIGASESIFMTTINPLSGLMTGVGMDRNDPIFGGLFTDSTSTMISPEPSSLLSTEETA